jgi:ABC-type multidrug transport system permease subunit
MNLDDHIRNIWIAVGVLSGLGLILAFARTTVWQARAGKQIVDLVVIRICNFFLSNYISYLLRRLENSLFMYLMFLQRYFLSLWLVFHYGG